MNERHYTAWLALDTSVLEGDFCDVTVIEDIAISYREDEDGNEQPVWASQGQVMFQAITTIDAEDGDASDAQEEARELMEADGWRIAGTWEASDTGYIVTVEYDGAYRHTIETTDHAEEPTWQAMSAGATPEKYEGTPEAYGREVLKHHWIDQGKQTPDFTDEFGNAHYRVVVRTQDTGAVLATVESTAAKMTAASFKATRELLGLSDGWLAEYLGVSSRTVRHWEAGKYAIPAGVEQSVRQLEHRTREAVAELVDQLKALPQPIAVTYRNDADYAAAWPDSQFPASWHRSVLARVATQVPGLGIYYADSNDVPAS